MPISFRPRGVEQFDVGCLLLPHVSRHRRQLGEVVVIRRHNRYAVKFVPDADIRSPSPECEPTLRLVAHNYHKLGVAACFRAWSFV